MNAVTRDHGNIWMLHRFCHLEHKFFCIQEDAFEEKSCYPFSILNLCSAPSRQRFRSAPNVGATSGKRKQFVKFIKKDLDKSRGRERRSEWRFFQRDGPTIDKALFCLGVVQALEAGQRSATRAGQSQDKELKKLSNHIAKDAVPGDIAYPIMDALLDRESLEDVSVIWPNLGTRAVSCVSISHRYLYKIMAY